MTLWLNFYFNNYALWSITTVHDLQHKLLAARNFWPSRPQLADLCSTVTSTPFAMLPNRKKKRLRSSCAIDPTSQIYIYFSHRIPLILNSLFPFSLRSSPGENIFAHFLGDFSLFPNTLKFPLRRLGILLIDGNSVTPPSDLFCHLFTGTLMYRFHFFFFLFRI